MRAVASLAWPVSAAVALLAWLASAAVASPADVAPRVLRVTPVASAPSDVTHRASATGAPAQLCAAVYEPADPVALDARDLPSG
ncbi:MAG: hypothetical protein FJ148_01570 [Deltaproteobacteria bacterium]|nr:hypothetical protein [Deltaproteobacteria bacterium]